MGDKHFLFVAVTDCDTGPKLQTVAVEAKTEAHAKKNFKRFIRKELPKHTLKFFYHKEIVPGFELAENEAVIAGVREVFPGLEASDVTRFYSTPESRP